MKLPFIIAEIGVNHDGQLPKAQNLIIQAKLAGASAVKFQSFSAEQLASQDTPKVAYQKNRDLSDSHFQMLKNLELTFDQQRSLFDFCLENQVEFLSTPYSCEQAEFLNELGVEKFKTASADIIDIPLHRKIASFNKLTIISTGMATIEEIRKVVEIYTRLSCPFALLHTTSEYPCPPSHANLKKIGSLKSFGAKEIGFSDHTLGNVAAQVALGLGCTIFEKHFTLNRSDSGPDHFASADPQEFKLYVNAIKEAWRFLGSDSALMSPAEIEMKSISRKSLCYSKAYSRGEIIDYDDLVLMRPGSGLDWWALADSLPMPLAADVKLGEQVKLSHFERS
jgi:N,N'-diacetyllegionaminate synthase